MLKPIPQTSNRILPAKSSDFPSGLVLHYDMQDLGLTLIDKSMMGNHGTNSGSVAQPALNGYSRYFDGVDDIITKSETMGNNIITGSFTMALWVKFSIVSLHQHLITKSDNNTKISFILTLVAADNTLQFAVSSAGNLYSNALSSTGTFAAGQWYHIAARLLSGSSGLISLFRNGVVSGTGAASTASIYESDRLIEIGAERTTNSPLNGNIGDIKIFNRALADTEIKEIFKNEAWRYGLNV